MRNLLIAFFLGFASITRAAHTQVRLILSADTARPGDTILAGLHLKMEPGWHTYWKNPGDAGMPTKIEWQLPLGITAGDIQWPLPEKSSTADITSYVYENEVVLIVPLKLAADLKPGPLDLKAKASWLECKEICVPASANVQAALNVSSETKPSADAAIIESWREKIPQAGDKFLFVHAWWEGPATNDTRPLIIEFGPRDSGVTLPPGSADFYPYPNDQFDLQGTIEKISDSSFRKPVRKISDDWPKEIDGVIVLESGPSRIGYEVNLTVADQPPPSSSNPLSGEALAKTEIIQESNNPSPPSVLPPQSLLMMLLYAFIGGLILNIMPCVLPVIALKILGFVGEARNNPKHIRQLGLMYAAGVLVSFLAFAAIVISVKAAGHRAGWGMQFSNPQFVVGLTVLVTLVALNLFGLFEVNLSGRMLGAVGALASQQGASGAFFNGALATILATPCTASYLSTALGFAFAQSAGVIVLIFLTVGVGLALPYVVLSWEPAWLKFLPRPGAWMEKFKIAMGFPMLATAVWLLNLTTTFYGKRVLWLGIFLVLAACAAWIFGEFIQRGRRHRIFAAMAIMILLAGGYYFILEEQLDWRTPLAENTSGSVAENGIRWHRWSPEAVNRSQNEGHLTLVDFTADWCVTCQVNKKTSIDAASVQSRLKEIGATLLIGDYTRTPDDITQELTRFGRAGVPLVLVYPGKAGAAPIVLPGFLTPGIVLAALDQAAK